MSMTAFLLAGALTGSFAAMPGDWISFDGNPGDEVHVELLESNHEGLVLEVTVPGFYLTELPADGTVYNRIELPGAALSWDFVGMPEVPLVPSLIGVPEGMTAVITDVERETVVFENILLFPSQEPATDHDLSFGTFVIDADAYSSETPWPAGFAELDMPGSISVCP